MGAWWCSVNESCKVQGSRFKIRTRVLAAHPDPLVFAVLELAINLQHILEARVAWGILRDNIPAPPCVLAGSWWALIYRPPSGPLGGLFSSFTVVRSARTHDGCTRGPWSDGKQCVWPSHRWAKSDHGFSADRTGEDGSVDLRSEVKRTPRQLTRAGEVCFGAPLSWDCG